MSAFDWFPQTVSTALLTDLYQLTMAAAYHAEAMHGRRGVFELFVRRLPEDRSYLVVAGIESFLDVASSLRFDGESIEYLRRLPALRRVKPDFFDYLASLRFEGDVHAMAEGTVAFAGEPIVRVSAPILQAQLLESIAINCINFQTSVATKSARVVQAARGRPVVDFGMRRAAGPLAAIWAARSALIGGAVGTSHVAAARAYGCEPSGTMAHSYVLAHDDEAGAFQAFAEALGDPVTALVDTYDVAGGVRAAIESLGPRLGAIRLDSGDLLQQSRMARAMLDEGGLRSAKVFASGDLNEYKIDALLEAGAAIDAFGVGTELTTVADAPSLAMVYKLVAFERADGSLRPCAKFSADKATIGHAKQVYRRVAGGRLAGDTLTCDGVAAEGEALLLPMLLAGHRARPPQPLSEIVQRAASQLAALPDSLRRLRGRGDYPVQLHPSLTDARPDR